MKSFAIKGGLSMALVVISLIFNFSCTNDNVRPVTTVQNTTADQQVNNKAEQQTQKIEFQSEGTITGPDMRLCPSPCCGGWDILIDSVNYTFSELPENSGIDLNNEKFPLKVRVVWSLDTTFNCNHIFIRWIRII